MNHAIQRNRTWLVTGGSGFIGTNLIDSLIKSGEKVRSVDVARPKVDDHVPLWSQLDINDTAALARSISEASPDVIVHLAAKVEFSDELSEVMRANVDGTKTLLDCALEKNVDRLILTSTQYVNGPGAPYDDDLVHHPVNAYSQSKAEMENIARRPEYERLDWVITRPTNIWGPYHPRFPVQMWKYIRRGLYLHPIGPPILRSYGYVGNVVKQIRILATAPSARVRHRVFYVSDPPIDSAILLDAMSLSLRGKPVRRVPRWMLRGMAYAGDVANLVGVPAPMTSDRYERMTTEHFSRREEIWSEFGYSETPLEEAVSQTAAWLRDQYPDVYAA